MGSGWLEPTELVEFALLALNEGFSGTALQQLAGLKSPSLQDLGILPQRTFGELGLEGIDQERAIEIVTDRRTPFSTPIVFDLVSSFPDFGPRWKKHVLEWGGIPAGSYIDLSEFVHFVVHDLYENGQIDELRRAFAWMEAVLVSVDQEAKDLVALVFFETLQCYSSWRSYGNKAFEPFLGINSQQVWKELQIIWQGKSSLMDVVRAEQREK